MFRFRTALWLVGLAALVLVCAWFWTTRQDAKPNELTVGGPTVPAYEAVEVVAREGQQALTLTGTVRDQAGQPIAEAEVSLAASTQPSLTTSHCGVCGQPLLSCRAPETARAISAAFDEHRGDLLAALTTRSDGQGRFRFERLAGTSFMVWARAPHYGEGMKERAAPGEAVELFLPRERTLVGFLKDEAGAPLVGTVRAMSQRLAHVVQTSSDATGHFTLLGLGEGPFYLQAVAPGHLPVARAQLEARPDPVVLSLPAARRLEVRVLSQGKPVDGAVVLQGNHLSREYRVREGFVGIDELYPGDLMVVAMSGNLASAPTRVTLAGWVTQLTLNLERAGALLVTVVDEEGHPVAESTVDLLTRSGELVARRKLKPGEVARFGPVGPGDYELNAASEGFASARVPAVVKATETAIEVALTRGTLISGRVIDEYGRPAPGVAVLVTPTGDSVVADAAGRFSAAVPSPGLYTLQAHHSDQGGGELKVTAPADDVALQLEPKAGAEVTVTLGGRRVEGAQVTLFHREGNFRSDRPSGADGVVLMRGLPNDTYTLVATHPDYLSSDHQTVTLAEGPLLKVTAELKEGAAISGQVVDTLGAPVSSVVVTVNPRGAEPATTDAEGHFSISPLRPGAVYGVRVAQRGFDQPDRARATAGGEPIRLVVNRQTVFHGRVLGDGQPLKGFRVDEFDVNSADGRFELPLPATTDRVVVTVEAPGFEPLVQTRPNSPDLGDFELKRAPQVTGIVRDEGGQAVPDAVVTCDSCEQSVLSDPSGRFALGKPAHQHEFKVLAKKARRTASRLVNAQATEGVELVLKGGVQLSGTVWLPSGSPAPGVEISGVGVDRSEVISVVTGADGTFFLEVPPGSYRFALSALGPGQLAEDQPALITEVSGAQARLDFGQAPGMGTVTARVSPLPGYALWLVRGDQRSFGNPPMELLRAPWAQMVYQPHVERVVFGGLTPGRYTLVWASFHAQTPDGPIVVPVDVPSPGEVRLTR